MLRLLHVIPHLDPGGTERQLAGTIQAAHGVHWDATLCVLNSGYELTRKIASGGVPVIELSQQRRRDLGRIARLRWSIESGAFDVVHSTLWRCNMVTRLASGYRGRPAVVVSERAVEYHRPWLEQLVDKLLRPLTDAYIGNSESVREFIVRTHRVSPERVFVVGNGIDGELFHPRVANDRKGQRFRIGSVGRLEHQKGYDVLLAALPLVRERFDVEVEIVGSGSLLKLLSEEAANLPVRFQGFLQEQRDVAEFLRSLDVFVLPSRFEGLPNALLEARACGVPVVATDIPGVREAGGPNVALVPPDDPRSLASAMLEVLARPSPVSVPACVSFDEVARRHLEAFLFAVSRRTRAV